MIKINDNAVIEFSGDKIILTKKIDDEAIKQYAKTMRDNETSLGGYGKAKWKEVAFIPIELLNALGEKGVAILNDSNELKKFLAENPEYKTTRGSL